MIIRKDETAKIFVVPQELLEMHSLVGTPGHAART
eukprot:gene8121-10116_t